MHPPTSKRARTFARLLECGLELFERQGYDDTTIAQIARAADVSEMTFFRYFPSKEDLLLDDPYDPLVHDAIAEQPIDLPPLMRAVRGIRSAWLAVPEPEHPIIRRRIRIAARTPSLRGAVWQSNGNTERVIRAQLIAGGAARDVASAAAAAVIAAMIAALFAWAEAESRTLAVSIDRALDVLDPSHGDGATATPGAVGGAHEHEQALDEPARAEPPEAVAHARPAVAPPAEPRS